MPRTPTLEIGGYGTARNTTFEVLGVPVVWLPWMLYPLKTERQTGLLFPLLSTGSIQGFSAALPFFWAAARERKRVAHARLVGEAGLRQPGVDRIRVRRGVQRAGRRGVSRRPEHRRQHPVRALRSQSLGHLGQAGCRVAGRRAREERLHALPPTTSIRPISRSSGSTGTTASCSRSPSRSATSARTAASGWSRRRSSPTISRARMTPIATRTCSSACPRSTSRVLPAPMPWSERVVPSLDLQIRVLPLGGGWGRDLPRHRHRRADRCARARSARRSRATTAASPIRTRTTSAARTRRTFTEGDGRYEEGELLANRGQRGTLTPRLAAPFRLGNFAELYPEVGWSQALYDSTATGFEERGLATARLDLETRLRKQLRRFLHASARAAARLCARDRRRAISIE